MSGFISGLKEFTIMEKMFFIILQFDLLLCLYLTLHFYITGIFTLVAFSVIFLFEILFLTKFNSKENYFSREIAFFILLFLLLAILPCCFAAVSSITFYKKHYDETLLAIDNYILGSFFEDGQFSFYLDKSEKFGPNSKWGIIIGSVLQYFYFFYYLVPYESLYLYYWMKCIRETKFRKQNNGEKSKTYNKNWNEMLFGFSTYNLVLIFVFFINSIVPATSPRIYYADRYKNNLVLPGIAGFLNVKCRDNKSANSFPSGHIAETGSFVLFFALTGHWIGFAIVLFVTILLGFGTIWLRYHYFFDACIAVAIAIFCPLFCYVFGFKKSKEEENQSDEDYEHKQIEMKGFTRQIDIIN